MPRTARSCLAFALLATPLGCSDEVVRPAALGGAGGAGSTGASSSTGTVVGPTGRVTIRAVDQVGAPVAGVPALASDADGAGTAQAATDVDGFVELDVFLQGAVSLFPGPGSCDDFTCHDGVIITLAGLEDGMSLTVPTSRPIDPPRPMRPTMDLEIVLPPLPEGAAHYRVDVPCRYGEETKSCGPGGFSFGEPVVAFEYPGCPGADAYDVYVILEESLLTGMVSYAGIFDQPFKPGEKVTHTVTMQEQPRVDVTWSVDAAGSEIDHAGALLVGRRRCDLLALGSPAVAGDVAAVQASLPPFFDEYMTAAFVDVLAKDAGVHQSWRSIPWSPGLEPRIPWTLGEPARVEEVVPVLAPDGRLRMTWLLAGEGELGVGLSAWVSYANESHGDLLWQVFRPPARDGSIEMPRLPDELSDYLPGNDLVLLERGGVHEDAAVGFADWLDGVGEDVEVRSVWRSY